MECMGGCGVGVDDGRKYCRECVPDRGRGVVACAVCGDPVADHPIGRCKMAGVSEQDGFRGVRAEDKRRSRNAKAGQGRSK